jgi:hypothetical protein
MPLRKPSSIHHRRGELNCTLFNADFPALSAERAIDIPDANLRVFLSKVRPKLRRIPVNAGRAISRMPERALPVAEMGTRQGEATTRYRRGSDLQGIGILHHRLPKRFLQGGSQEGISCHLVRWREIRYAKGTRERFVACSG